ncbi:MAG: 6-carboxytetrahydropterin synthase QueD [Thermodesulfobacteriota bacterium]
MYELTVETWFSAAHNLREYKGKCEALHGHNWKVEVAVTAEKLDDAGMVVDFKVLKKETEDLLDTLDHKYLNEIPPFDAINVTAENIARFIFEELSGRLNDGNIRVARVRAWESHNAAAAYCG